MNIAIMTDSNSGITQAQGKELGIYVVPMPFYIEGELYFEDVNLTREEFFARQAAGAEISTSMPSPGDLLDQWKTLLKEYDQIIYIPMSSALSSSCATSLAMAEDEFPDRVFVVDNQRISVTQRESVLAAKAMAENGMSGAEIRDRLLETKSDSSIYIAVDTLTYLKKGGRITPAAAAVGTLLRIKPVLQIQGGKLDAFAKCRTVKHARTTMLEAISDDLENRFRLSKDSPEAVFAASHTMNDEDAAAWLEEIRQAFPGREIHMDPLSLSIACHIGPGSSAVTVGRKIPTE